MISPGKAKLGGTGGCSGNSAEASGAGAGALLPELDSSRPAKSTAIATPM